jgi:hypothetical protein
VPRDHEIIGAGLAQVLAALEVEEARRLPLRHRGKEDVRQTTRGGCPKAESAWAGVYLDLGSVNRGRASQVKQPGDGISCHAPIGGWA